MPTLGEGDRRARARRVRGAGGELRGQVEARPAAFLHVVAILHRVQAAVPADAMSGRDHHQDTVAELLPILATDRLPVGTVPGGGEGSRNGAGGKRGRQRPFEHADVAATHLVDADHGGPVVVDQCHCHADGPPTGVAVRAPAVAEVHLQHAHRGPGRVAFRRPRAGVVARRAVCSAAPKPTEAEHQS